MLYVLMEMNPVRLNGLILNKPECKKEGNFLKI
jgi:hypothetical protein